MLAFVLSAAFAQQGIESDPKLSLALPMVENAVPVSTFVSDLAKATGTTLTCDSHIREDLVVVVTKPRPANEIMKVVADHFGWRWTHVGPGAYKLEPSEKWLRIVRAGVYQDLLPDWQKARAKAKEYVASLAKLNPRDLESKAIHQATHPDDEDGNIYQTLGLRDPFTLLSARILAGLTDAQLTGLRNRRLVMSTSPGPLCVAIPAEWQSEVGRAVQDLCDLNQRMAAYNTPQAHFRADEVAEVRFAIERPAAIEYLLLNGKRQVLAKGLVMPPRPQRGLAPPLADPVRKAIEAQKPLTEWITNTSQPFAGFCDFATGIARKLDKDFIGDAYDPYLRMDNTSERWNNLSWLTISSDGWLKMRARRWAVLRAQTVPRTLWTSLRGLIPQELSLDEKATFATRLEEEQNRSPLVGWTAGDMNFYRFWQSLPAPARNTLRSGASLPLADLPKGAHEFMFMSEPGGEGISIFANELLFSEPEFDDRRPDANRGDGLTLDTDYAGIYPKWIAPGANLQAKVSNFPVLYLSSLRVPLGPGLLTLSAAGMQEMTEDPAIRGTTLYLAQANVMRFRFNVAPGVTYERKEVEYKIGKEVSFDPATWPKDLIARVKAADERRLKSGEGPPGIGTIPP